MPSVWWQACSRACLRACSRACLSSVNAVKSVKSLKKHKPLYFGYMYVPQSPKIFPKPILLDYLGQWRNQSCQIFFQSVYSGVFGKGSNFAIFSANRRWPLQLLYYRTTVIGYLGRMQLAILAPPFWVYQLMTGSHFPSGRYVAAWWRSSNNSILPSSDCFS